MNVRADQSADADDMDKPDEEEEEEKEDEEGDDAAIGDFLDPTAEVEMEVREVRPLVKPKKFVRNFIPFRYTSTFVNVISASYLNSLFIFSGPKPTRRV